VNKYYYYYKLTFKKRRDPAASIIDRRTEVVFVFGLEWHEAEYERDDGGNDENDERHVLQRFPRQPQERLGRLGRDVVGSERLGAMLPVDADVAQSCRPASRTGNRT